MPGLATIFAFFFLSISPARAGSVLPAAPAGLPAPEPIGALAPPAPTLAPAQPPGELLVPEAPASLALPAPAPEAAEPAAPAAQAAAPEEQAPAAKAPVLDSLLQLSQERAEPSAGSEESRSISAARWDQEGARSSLPESEAWSLPDGGPLLGRFLEPEGTVYGGRRYVDFMNPAALSLEAAGGGKRLFLWVRAVRAGYVTEPDPKGPPGAIRTKDYFSDILLFELKGDKLDFIERPLESSPDELIEDPRVSSYRSRGRDPATGRLRVREQHLLGVTRHARFGGMSEPTSRNAFLSLRVGADGVPRPERDADGRPVFRAMSPEPLALPGGGHAVVDAKNGVILTDALGRLKLHSRHRYQEGDPRLPAGFKPAPYSEQSYPLPGDFLEKGVPWDALLAEADGRELMRSETIKDHYPARLSWPGSPKGSGPGAQPVRLQRRGGSLFVSEGWGYPWVEVPGELSPRARAFLRDRRSYFAGFDHELRYLSVGGSRKRVYTASVKLWNPDLDRVVAILPDAVQPLRPYERENPGITDLWHVYPTARHLKPDGSVDTFETTADGNVVRRRWDLVRLVEELALRGERPQR